MLEKELSKLPVETAVAILQGHLPHPVEGPWGSVVMLAWSRIDGMRIVNVIYETSDCGPARFQDAWVTDEINLLGGLLEGGAN